MRILVACEFSGIVRDAFIEQGHDAMSCDLLSSERPGPHYRGDVRDILGDGWDLLIGHPPCTCLSAAGAHLWPRREAEIAEAFRFFLELYNAPVPHVALENPQGWLNTHFRKPDQTFHPWYFGEPYKKRTCLWLRNVPPLMASYHLIGVRESWVNSTNNYRNRFGEGYTIGVARSPHDRSRTLPGVAAAMALQWGSLAARVA